MLVNQQQSFEYISIAATKWLLVRQEVGQCSG